MRSSMGNPTNLLPRLFGSRRRGWQVSATESAPEGSALDSLLAGRADLRSRERDAAGNDLRDHVYDEQQDQQDDDRPHGTFSFSFLTGAPRIHPLAWLERQLLVIAFAFYAGAVALFIAAGLTGCSTPARTAGLAIGAAIVVAAAHNHDHDASARPDVPVPGNPCARNLEACR
jgi:hypothetical protein